LTSDDAFLKAILADPNDDAPRLIYADWLDEQGRHERAEFIRVQVALSGLDADDSRRDELEARERELESVAEGVGEPPGSAPSHIWRNSGRLVPGVANPDRTIYIGE
jgi:uncharacterized protein (TIGR02996 family)